MIELDLDNAIALLANQTNAGLLLLFWYAIVLEFPRYGLTTIAYLVTPSRLKPEENRRPMTSSEIKDMVGSVSVVVIGLNEGNSLETCIRSLREQSFNDFEIVIVSDGSSDHMPEVAAGLVRKGLANKAYCTDFRCGKSSGSNLAVRYATGDIVINVDCDCSYDRYAIERILMPFADSNVGVVSGDIIPRNGTTSLVAAFQVIEYGLSISLGKRSESMLDMVVCASGAFGAFRRTAIEDVGFVDPGGGEDLDVTLRLRNHGWRIVFAGDAVCYTDVPDTDWGLIRQRLRWERDALRVRYRKNGRTLLPTYDRFKFSEALHQLDFLLFNVLLGIAFPIYLIAMAITIGPALLYWLIAVQIVLMVVLAVMFVLMLAVTGRWSYLSYLIYIPGYAFFQIVIMRAVCLFSYVQEWTTDASRTDTYVPHRVLQARMW